MIVRTRLEDIFNFSRRAFTALASASILVRVNSVEANLKIENRLGLHLRAASTLAQTAARFKSQITIIRGKEKISAKSVTGLMMLGAGIGSKLKVRAEGEDAREAIKEIEQLFRDRFGEE